MSTFLNEADEAKFNELVNGRGVVNKAVFNFVAEHPGADYWQISEGLFPGRKSSAGAHEIYTHLRSLHKMEFIRRERAMKEDGTTYYKWFATDPFKNARFDVNYSYKPKERGRVNKRPKKVPAKATPRIEVKAITKPEVDEELGVPNRIFGVEKLIVESARLDLEGKRLFLENQKRLQSVLNRVTEFFGVEAAMDR